jgi:DoxX-like protein
MSKSASSKANVALWIVQVILGALFIFAGGMKLIVPIAVLAKQMPVALPGAFIHTIGVLEFAGGLGLILPGLLRFGPYLTPLAASGLVIVMSGAIGTSVTTGPFKLAGIPFVVGLLAAVVAYGRARVVPLAQRDRSARAGNASMRPLLHHAA